MASAAQKPVIVLVHGAWHQPLHYKLLIESLREQDYTVLAPINTTVGIDSGVVGKTYRDDVKRIHDYMLPYLDEGREAIVVCHSLGGLAGTASVEGQTSQERAARGLKGGIREVLYISSLLPPARGMSVFELLGRAWPDWHSQGDLVRTTNTLATEIFYNDIPSETQAWASSFLMSQSESSLMEPVAYIASDIKCPKTYFVCTDDKAISVDSQEAMAGAAEAQTVELASGHSPFLKEKETQEIVQVLNGIAVK